MLIQPKYILTSYVYDWGSPTRKRRVSPKPRLLGGTERPGAPHVVLDQIDNILSHLDSPHLFD